MKSSLLSIRNFFSSLYEALAFYLRFVEPLYKTVLVSIVLYCVYSFSIMSLMPRPSFNTTSLLIQLLALSP